MAVPVDSLRVMTYNIWGSGFGAGLPLSHTAGVITAAGADVIALQEAGASVDDIANLLGFHWQFFNSDLSLISRYPITQVVPATPGTGSARTRGAKIELSPGQEVYLFDIHLEPFPYEPYNIRDGLITTEAQAIASAVQSVRGASITTGLTNASGALATGLPVFFVGDFNEPSHLDWTQEAADAGMNFDMKVNWPTSNAVVNAGLSDAFREVRPDEVNDQARTWTPGYPPPTVSANEVHDRIDLVYYKAPANVRPVEALTLGYNANDGFTDIAIQPYPSDHRSVVVEFDLDFTPGDFDNDGDVDGEDFLVWQRGDSPNPLSEEDLADWQASYGTGSLSSSSDVPEPSTWLIFCLGGTLLVRATLLASYGSGHDTNASNSSNLSNLARVFSRRDWQRDSSTTGRVLHGEFATSSGTHVQKRLVFTKGTSFSSKFLGILSKGTSFVFKSLEFLRRGQVSPGGLSRSEIEHIQSIGAYR